MEPVRDPGAARERTWLAWQRTAIVIAANGILLLRSPDAWIGVSAILVLCAAPFVALATSDQLPVRVPGTRTVHAVLAIAIGIGVLDIIAILRPPP